MSKPSLKTDWRNISKKPYPPVGESQDRWVFINISIEDNYRDLRQAIIFGLIFMRFWPRSTSEKPFGASEIRFQKIVELIRDCKYSLHDLSCTELDNLNNLPRFNMPFELGLAMGNNRYSDSEKDVFVLDGVQHQFRKCCSDLECFDFPYHEKNPDIVITKIREWLDSQVPSDFPRGHYLVEQYHSFCEWLPIVCKEKYKLSPEELNFIDIANMSLAWIRDSAIDPN